ncbi:EF-hand domain-containing protein [Sphingopyxis kveilinensis]|uniref:EF-hand domain-containing protein n=1 Tax=Sphingopyxis kveilinensis TaxID=3114367 RepID=UPI0030D0499C
MKTWIWAIAATALAMPALATAQQPGGGRMFAMLDADGNGKLDKAEVTRMMTMRADRSGDASMKSPEKIAAFMKRADSNGDGAIDQAELAAFRKAQAAKAN